MVQQMPKSSTVYICQTCGTELPKWSGQCPNCSAWNSLVETVAVSTKTSRTSRAGRASSTRRDVKPLRLSEVEATGGLGSRVTTGIGEFDRVLGGGLVAGSVVLVAGEPGIGKSTLLTQLALKVAGDPSTAKRTTPAWRAQDDKPDLKSVSGLSSQGKAVLYVCGEESPEQVKLRADRLLANGKLKMDNGKFNESNLFLFPSTDVDQIVRLVEQVVQVDQVEQGKLGLVIVDSVQTLSTGDLSGMAGSVGQIRESAFRLIESAKQTSVPLILVGHVTKEGAIAGPKILEHMVDVVLSLEGDRDHDFRILRTSKNRFGATDEVGVFTMGDSGMEEVSNPSDVFLEERPKNVAGSVVVATVTGLRPMLVEIQALVVSSQLVIPRRVSTGIDQRKLQLLAAVLQKHCRLGLGGSDIFVNVAGGLKLDEPAVDLGLALAIASGFANKPLPPKTVAIGEVGLLGEIRQVGRLKQRVAEAKRLGYTTVVSPEEYKTLQEVVRKVLG